MKNNKYLNKLLIMLLLFFLYTPIFLIILYSFNESKYIGHWTSFSFKWYEQLFNNKELFSSVIFTIIIATLASIVSVFIGFIFSISSHFSSTSKSHKTFLLNLNQLALITPDIVLGISYMLLFSLINIELSWITILLSHIFFNVPVVIIIIKLNFSDVNPNLVLSAQDLGANTFNTIKNAIIPPMKYTLFTALALCFSFSIDDFIVTYFTSGEGTTTLSIEIFTQIKRQISPEINALYTILFILIIIVLIFNKLIKSNKKRILINNFNNYEK